MAQRPRRGAAEPEPEPELLVSRSRLDQEITVRIEKGQELLGRSISSSDDLAGLKNDFYTWDEYNEQLLRTRFSGAKVANVYRGIVLGFGDPRNPQQELEFLGKDINRKLRRLESIQGQLELYDAPGLEESGNLIVSASQPVFGQKVFIVHGHDGAAKLEVTGFIENITGERPTILHEQPNYGSRTIIEKFEANASEAGFAVILLTGDDEGGVKGESTQKPRARQNVVLEFGYFMGRLGRSRVVALYESNVELPSDVNGVMYMPFTGNWKLDLAKELQAAGIRVDMSKLF